MADVTTGYYSNQSAGVREMKDTIYDDVEGIIQIISPSDTPFLASIGSVSVTQPLHEWLEDDLKTPTGTNYAVDGADATSTSRTPAARKSNYTQIIQDTFKISGTQEVTRAIGRKEIPYQTDNSLKYLNTELEYACLNNSSAVAGDSATARQMKGLEGFVSTNDKSYASYAATNDFSEAKFLEMAQACYSAGGKPSLMLLAPAQARKVAGWNQGGRVVINTNASEKTLIMAIMVLETPFGRVKVAIDRFIAQDTSTDQYDRTYLVDPERISLGTLRPAKTVELAKAGDARKFQSIFEGCLVVHNEKSAAKCKKCATD